MQTKTLVCNEITVRYKPLYKTQTFSKITSSDDAYTEVMKFFNDDTLSMQEQFVVIYLNRANQVIGGYKHTTGGITGTVADLRIILSIALKVLATGVILSHNHPSGNRKPSSADVELTNKFKKAADMLDIKLFDHIIVTDTNEYYSFSDEGLI